MPGFDRKRDARARTQRVRALRGLFLLFGGMGCASSTTPGSEAGAPSAVVVRRLSYFDSHGCVARRDGSLWCWGTNSEGQLGVGGTASSAVPLRVAASMRWTSVAVGHWHSCAVRDDGALYCWGHNLFGQLGDGTRSARDVPTRVPGSQRWLTVAAGGGGTCAIDSENALWCWGGPDYGQSIPGFVPQDARLLPEPIGSERSWVELSLNWYGQCARRSDGSLWCRQNESLSPDAGVSRFVLTRFEDSTGWTRVGLGVSRLCALQGSGALSCWEPFPGQADQPSRRFALPGTSWADLSVHYRTLALRSDGTAASWDEALGGPSSDAGTAPREVPSVAPWSEVARGSGTACALALDDSVWCWTDAAPTPTLLLR